MAQFPDENRGGAPKVDDRQKNDVGTGNADSGCGLQSTTRLLVLDTNGVTRYEHRTRSTRWRWPRPYARSARAHEDRERCADRGCGGLDLPGDVETAGVGV